MEKNIKKICTCLVAAFLSVSTVSVFATSDAMTVSGVTVSVSLSGGQTTVVAVTNKTSGSNTCTVTASLTGYEHKSSDPSQIQVCHSYGEATSTATAVKIADTGYEWYYAVSKHTLTVPVNSGYASETLRTSI